MPLTPRFHELIDELDLPEAAWHLKRTNTWTEKHADKKDIRNGYKQIMNLVSNKNNCVNTLLEKVEKELESITPMDILLKQRQEATLEQWWQPVTNESAQTHYNNTIQTIKRRLILERTKRHAETILNGWLTVIQWGGKDKEQHSFVIVKKIEWIQKAA